MAGSGHVSPSAPGPSHAAARPRNRVLPCARRPCHRPASPVYHFWMRIFSGRVPAGNVGQPGRLVGHRCAAQGEHDTSTAQRQLPAATWATARRHQGGRGGAPVCAATIFFRSPMVSSSLHLTRICDGPAGRGRARSASSSDASSSNGGSRACPQCPGSGAPSCPGGRSAPPQSWPLLLDGAACCPLPVATGLPAPRCHACWREGASRWRQRRGVSGGGGRRGVAAAPAAGARSSLSSRRRRAPPQPPRAGRRALHARRASGPATVVAL